MAVEVERLLVTLEARTAEYQRQLGQAQQQTNRQLAAIESRFAKTSASVRNSSSSMAMGVTGVLGSIGAALAISTVTEYANAWTRVTRSLTASQPVFGVSLRSAQDLTDLANDARVDLEAYSKLYIRTSAAIRDYGFEAGTAEKVTSTLAKALKLGGATAGEQASVLLQFSQALQKGKLDGDEFRSVMENAGIVQELLAKRLGVTKGAIVEMAAAGKLQIPDLVGALTDGGAQVERIYRQMPQTIDEAFTVLRNNVIQFIGEADKASGASQSIANGIVAISQNLDKLAVVIGAILGSATVRMLAFAAATMGAANPMTLLAAAVGAIATAYVVYGDDVSVAEDKTVKLQDTVQAFAEVVGGAATEAVGVLKTAINDLASSNEEAALSFQKLAKETGLGFADLVAKALIFQDKIAIGPSIIDGLLSLDAALGKVEERAKALSIARNFPDFGKIIRDAEAGLLAGPVDKRKDATGSGTDKRSQFEREVDAIRKRTAALQAEAETIGATTFVQEKARVAAELRAAAMTTAAKQSRSVSASELEAIEKLSDAYAQAQAQADFLNAVQQESDRTQQLQDELALLGLTGVELSKARIMQEQINAARRAGRVIDEGEMIRIKAIAEQNARLERQNEIMADLKATANEALSSFVSDLREGVSATEALGNSLNRIADKLIDMAINNLVTAAFGGLTGNATAGSGGSILGMFGLAEGGVFTPGQGLRSLPRYAGGGVSRRAAIFGEAGPEAAVPLPDGRRIPVDLRMGAKAAAGGGANITIAPVFNVQNGTPEGVNRMRQDIVPVIRDTVRKELGQVFDRERRFTRSGL